MGQVSGRDKMIKAMGVTRVEATPYLVSELRELTETATRIADRLEEQPGMGMGLTYGTLRLAGDSCESAVMHYQNDLS